MQPNAWFLVDFWYKNGDSARGICVRSYQNHSACLHPLADALPDLVHFYGR